MGTQIAVISAQLALTLLAGVSACRGRQVLALIAAASSIVLGVIFFQP